MSKKDYIGTNQFAISIPIAKSYQKTEADGTEKMYIAGLASGIGLDHDGERMATTAIDAFKKAIEDGVVLPNGKWSLLELRSGHRKEWDDVLGWITKADIDDDYNLWIEAELDDTSTTATDLYRKLNQGDRPGKPLQLGLSVGGMIKKASFEWNVDTQKRVRVIEDISLREVSVVGAPAYPPSYVEALTKSVNWDDVPPPKEEIMTQKDEKVEERPAEKTQTQEPQSRTEKLLQNEMKPSEKAVEETQPQEETEKAETTTESTEEVKEGTEKSIYFSEDARDIRELMEKLQSQIDSLKEAMGATKALAEQAEETAEKATEEVKKEEVKNENEAEKSASDVNDRIVAGITAAFEKFTNDVIKPLTTDIQAVKSSVDEMAKEPLDKSRAVRTAKEGGLEPMEKFQQRVEEAQTSKSRNFNLIEEAVRSAVLGE